MERELDGLNIRRVRQLAVMEPCHLELAFGRFGAVLQQRARGVDPRPVQPPLYIKKICLLCSNKSNKVRLMQ